MVPCPLRSSRWATIFMSCSLMGAPIFCKGLKFNTYFSSVFNYKRVNSYDQFEYLNLLPS